MPLTAARQVGPAGRVIAFEPDPRTFDALQANIEENDLANIVSAHSSAVSATSGPGEFHLSSMPYLSSLAAPRRYDKPVPVEKVALDDFLGGKKVDVVKMDIEGGEPEALAGTRATIAGNPSMIPFAELNPASLRRSGHTGLELVEALRGLFGNLRAIDDDRGLELEVTDELISAGVNDNLVCRQPMASLRGGG